MRPKLQELIDVAAEIEQLLLRAEEPRWAEWVAKARSEMMASDHADLRGVERLLAAYDGARSLKDVVVVFVAGDSSLNFVEAPENDRFEFVRSRAFELAAELKYEAATPR